MSRLVQCIKLKKKAIGLLTPPFPGEKGMWVFENVSQEAWNMWTKHQTRLINEKHLNLLDAEVRSYLADQMQKFCRGDTVDEAQGYVPEKK